MQMGAEKNPPKKEKKNNPSCEHASKNMKLTFAFCKTLNKQSILRSYSNLEEQIFAWVIGVAESDLVPFLISLMTVNLFTSLINWNQINFLLNII